MCQFTVRGYSVNGIDFYLAVSLISNLKIRREWDKTFDELDVLDRIGNFQVLYA